MTVFETCVKGLINVNNYISNDDMDCLIRGAYGMVIIFAKFECCVSSLYVVIVVSFFM